MSRKLDVAIAQLLGEKVKWIKIIDGYKMDDYNIDNAKHIVNYEPVIEMEDGIIQYRGYSEDHLYVATNTVPRYSTNGIDMLELDRIMRERNWLIRTMLSFQNETFIGYSLFEDGEKVKTVVASAETEILARALAVYYALAGKEWEEEGE